MEISLYEKIINAMLVKKLRGNIEFSLANTPLELQAIKSFRLQHYAKTIPYMLNELSASGEDAYDEHSYLFTASYQNTVIASIRLTPYPYEVLQYIEATTLKNYLGENWQSYLEWSRLLVAPAFQTQGVMQALLVFSGIHALRYANETRYFGYAAANVKKLFSIFQLSTASLKFKIPNRRIEDYYLFKGEFQNDFQQLKKIFLKSQEVQT